MAAVYQFQEHSLTVTGERKDILTLAEFLRYAEGTLGDLRYRIEYAFDIDGVRSSNTEDPDHNDACYADRYLIYT